jgi:hypothetical protein
VGTCELMHQDFISKSYTQEWQSNAYKKLDRPMVELPTDGIAFVNDLVERDHGERLRLPHCTEGKRLRRVGFYPGIRLAKVSNNVGDAAFAAWLRSVVALTRVSCDLFKSPQP